MIEVSKRAKTRSNAGDPLDGLVNLFDLGIVLAVAFLIAALQSLNLTEALTRRATVGGQPQSVVVKPDEKVVPLTPGAKRIQVTGGGKVGSVYKLPDGRLVYVTKK